MYHSLIDKDAMADGGIAVMVKERCKTQTRIDVFVAVVVYIGMSPRSRAVIVI